MLLVKRIGMSGNNKRVYIKERRFSMFGRKKVEKIEYDKENLRPVLKCSICNGEQVAGFRNIHTGKFEEIMLIRNKKDLDRFMELYDISDIKKEY